MNVILRKLSGEDICYLSLSSFSLSSSRSCSILLCASASIFSLSILISCSLSSSCVFPSRSSLYLEIANTTFTPTRNYDINVCLREKICVSFSVRQKKIQNDLQFRFYSDLMHSVHVCTWPPAPCAGPPGCGCYCVAESVCPAAPPAPPPAAAALPSSAHGLASEHPPWPLTPPAPAPTPWTLPPEPHTWPHCHCSVPALLHAGSSVMLAPPGCVVLCV